MQNFEMLLAFFYIYAFLGWCTEVAYATIQERKFINRGFLNGPVCPIYGVGVLVVLLLLEPLRHNLLLLFVGSVVLTSVLEFLTGFVLEKAFNDKWWDYSHRRFQLMGYVCLEFSMMWGAACVVVVRLVHPVVNALVVHMPPLLGEILLLVISAGFLADAAITVSTMLRMKRNLRLLREISRELRAISDDLGERLSDGVLSAMERAEEQLTIAQREANEKLLELRGRYQELLGQCGSGHRRLLCAFPRLRRGINREAVERLRADWENRINKAKSKRQK